MTKPTTYNHVFIGVKILQGNPIAEDEELDTVLDDRVKKYGFTYSHIDRVLNRQDKKPTDFNVYFLDDTVDEDTVLGLDVSDVQEEKLEKMLEGARTEVPDAEIIKVSSPFEYY